MAYLTDQTVAFISISKHNTYRLKDKVQNSISWPMSKAQISILFYKAPAFLRNWAILPKANLFSFWAGNF